MYGIVVEGGGNELVLRKKVKMGRASVVEAIKWR